MGDHKATIGSTVGRGGWADLRNLIIKAEKEQAKKDRREKKEARRKADAQRPPTVSKNLKKHQDRA